MTMNPADEAAENYKNEMDKLRAEVLAAIMIIDLFSFSLMKLYLKQTLI